MDSDGDTKTINLLKKENLYNVEKLECINHVSERLGKALRQLSNVGGKGKGRLTQKKIKKLPIYYSNAVSIHSYIFV